MRTTLFPELDIIGARIYGRSLSKIFAFTDDNTEILAEKIKHGRLKL